MLYNVFVKLIKSILQNILFYLEMYVIKFYDNRHTSRLAKSHYRYTAIIIQFLSHFETSIITFHNTIQLQNVPEIVPDNNISMTRKSDEFQR